jgi:pilus assembly protein CpaC
MSSLLRLAWLTGIAFAAAMAMVSVGVGSCLAQTARAGSSAMVSGGTSRASTAASGASSLRADVLDPVTNPVTRLTVGRSMYVNSQARLRRVYVNNPAVLDSFTASPNQIVITAKATGAGTVVVWDENGASQSYPITVDVDVAPLRRALKAGLPQQEIGVEADEGRVALTGTLASAAAADTALKLAAVYSKEVANALRVVPPRTRQIRLQVRIVEVDRTKLEQFGFNVFGVGTTTFNSTTQQFPSIGGNSNSGSSASGSATNPLTQSLLALTDPLNFLLFNSKTGVGAVLKDLADKQLAQILAEPTITALDGEKASFLSGGEFPFPVVQGGTGGFTSVTIQFRPYGVKLDFTPTVTEAGTIRLKVSPEVSALDYTNSVTISGYTIPALSTRRAETEVELRDGQTFAISGLLDHRTTDLWQRTPGIASVPLLGDLFKSKNLNHSTVELMVLVTPELVDPLTDTTPPTAPKLPRPFLDPKQFDSKKFTSGFGSAGSAQPNSAPSGAGGGTGSGTGSGTESGSQDGAKPSQAAGPGAQP